MFIETRRTRLSKKFVAETTTKFGDQKAIGVADSYQQAIEDCKDNLRNLGFFGPVKYRNGLNLLVKDRI